MVLTKITLQLLVTANKKIAHILLERGTVETIYQGGPQNPYLGKISVDDQPEQDFLKIELTT